MTPALELIGICKSFGAVEANKNVSISIARGSIHGIVGENGAGKSTLMSILFGERRADRGEIRVDGMSVSFSSPRNALARGIGMVHQHFQLTEAMSVIDNIMLGAEGGLLLARGRKAVHGRLQALARDYGLAIDDEALVSDLPVGLRQRVEILKALTRDARILVFDEPTAVLTPGEVSEIFKLMRLLRDAGASLIFITHKLREVIEVTDHVSVMRRGAIVAEFETARTNTAELAGAMMGRAVAPATQKQVREPGPPRFSVRDLVVVNDAGATSVERVSFELHAGEIVGIAGVSGNGQTELLEALAGMRMPVGGGIAIDGAAVDMRDHTPHAMRAHGIMHVPEDRIKHGLVMDFPASQSAMLGYQHEKRYGARFFSRAAISRECAGLMARWDVRPPTPELTTGGFSGGNQQKLVLAREIERDPHVLLVGQPTRGVDIGAIEMIHARLLALRDAGKAILLVSNELDEILTLADRILVMYGGRIVGVRKPQETNARELGLLMAGIVDFSA